MCRLWNCPILLRRRAHIFVLQDARRQRSGDVESTIGAERIDNEYFVGKCHTFEARADHCFFVAAGDKGCQSRRGSVHGIETSQLRGAPRKQSNLFSSSGDNGPSMSFNGVWSPELCSLPPIPNLLPKP